MKEISEVCKIMWVDWDGWDDASWGRSEVFFHPVCRTPCCMFLTVHMPLRGDFASLRKRNPLRIPEYTGMGSCWAAHGWKIEDWRNIVNVALTLDASYASVGEQLGNDAELCSDPILLLWSYSGANGQIGRASVIGWCMPFKVPF